MSNNSSTTAKACTDANPTRSVIDTVNEWEPTLGDNGSSLQAYIEEIKSGKVHKVPLKDDLGTSGLCIVDSLLLAHGKKAAKDNLGITDSLVLTSCKKIDIGEDDGELEDEEDNTGFRKNMTVQTKTN